MDLKILKIPLYVITLLNYNILNVYGYKILMVSAQAKSHFLGNIPIMEELLERGHHVYVVLGTEFGKTVKDKLMDHARLHIMHYKQNPNGTHGGNVDQLLAMVVNEGVQLSFFDARAANIAKFIPNECKDILSDNSLMSKLRKTEFDLAFSDGMTLIPCHYIVPVNLSVPFIGQEPIMFPWHKRIPALPSFVPNVFSPLSDEMNFKERIFNLGMYAVTEILSVFPGSNDFSLLEVYAPGIKSYRELLKEASMTVILRDFILEGPHPTMPDIVSVPGISFQCAEILPVEIRKIMDDSIDGVIVVSFGTTFSKLAPRFINRFITGLSYKDFTTYSTIISYSGDKANLVEDIPDNIYILPWVPQNDILGHPKTRLFINHGGHYGQSEAVYHGVPMITIGLQSEQIHNGVRIEKRKFGLALDFSVYTDVEFRNAVKEVLTNPEYRINIKKASAILKSMPKHPKEIIVDKIEQVVKFGSKHLKSHALDMPLYEFLMIDVILVLFLATLILSSLVAIFLYKLYKYAMAMSTSPQKVKVN